MVLLIKLYSISYNHQDDGYNLNTLPDTTFNFEVINVGLASRVNHLSSNGLS